MAKYTRFDPRNKKRNRTKIRTKLGLNIKKIHHVGKVKDYDEVESIQTSTKSIKL